MEMKDVKEEEVSKSNEKSHKKEEGKNGRKHRRKKPSSSEDSDPENYLETIKWSISRFRYHY